MNVRTVLTAAGVTVAGLTSLYAMPGSDLPASAQTAPPVTAPCDDPQCGPNPPATGNEAKAFAFGNFYCDPVKGISVTVGVGRRGQPTMFAVTIAGGLDKEMLVGPVQPGRSVTTNTFAVPSGHVQVTVSTDGTAFANPIPNRQLPTVRSFPITCECPDQPATTTTSPTTTEPPSSVPSTKVPGQPTTSVPPGSSAPGTTQPFRLPDTGATTPLLVALGLAVVGAGTFALIYARNRNDEQ